MSRYASAPVPSNTSGQLRRAVSRVRQRVDRAPRIEREPVACGPRRTRDACEQPLQAADFVPEDDVVDFARATAHRRRRARRRSLQRSRVRAARANDRASAAAVIVVVEPVSPANRSHDRAQHANQVFGALRVAGEPEQVVHRAARRFVAGTPDLDARGRRAQQAERIDRTRAPAPRRPCSPRPTASKARARYRRRRCAPDRRASRRSRSASRRRTRAAIIGREVNAPRSNVGATPSGTRSWTTSVAPRRSMSSAKLRQLLVAQIAAEPRRRAARKERPGVERVADRCRAARAPSPRRGPTPFRTTRSECRATSSSSPKSARETFGQIGVERRRFDHAAAERVGHHDVAGADGFDQPGHAERRIGAQFERIGEIRVEPAEDHRDAFESAQRAQVDVAVAHRQVVALDEFETQDSARGRRVRSRLRCRRRA